MEEYDDVRMLRPSAFIVKPGHERGELERVIEEGGPRYLFVEKTLAFVA